MPIITAPVASNLNELATSMLNISNDKSIYLYKDDNGVVRANTLEQYTNDNQFGYPFQFINGDTVWTSVPITQYSSIPWNFTNSILGALWNSKLSLWLDAKDSRTFSSDLQKWISKGYNGETQMIENTTSQSFSLSNNSVDLTTQANVESPATVAVNQYFKIAMVLTLPTQNISGKVIFQHNRFSIRITQQTAPNTSTTFQIGCFDNGTFIRGVSFKSPEDLTFKYYIYADNTGSFIVNGNTSAYTASPSYYQVTNQKVYIGQDSAGLNNSAIKVNEILYFQSSSNDITSSSNDMWTYLSTRWTLTTYTDTFNIYPASWTNALSYGNRTSSITCSVSQVAGNGVQTMVDGIYVNGPYSNGGVGAFVKFQFVSAIKIAGFKFVSSGMVPENDTRWGYTNFQGSNDDTAWTTLHTGFRFGAYDPAYVATDTTRTTDDPDYGALVDFNNLFVQTRIFTNTTGYTYYRFYCTACGTHMNAFSYYDEFLFKIAP